MLKWYGYVGLALIVLTELNFLANVQPFADWYVVIVWYGYILFIDSLVYKLKKRSIISSYPREFAFMLIISVPFWLIFEFYNLFTVSWIYVNYLWYVHPVDFTTILPAMLETFSLMSALNLGKRFDKHNNKQSPTRIRQMNAPIYWNTIRLLVVAGAIVATFPILFPKIGFPFMWISLFLLLDPLNYLIGRPSVVQKVAQGMKGIILRMFFAGIMMGFFWEFWNYQAYPKWQYNLPFVWPSIKLFAMPLLGYLGYLPFAMETFLFFALFRSFIFKKGNELLSI